MLDQIRFLKSLAERPRMTGAIAPSGPALAKRMASHVDPDEDLPVIELGPGTGVVTRALIERGVAPKRIIAIEYSPDFCRLLGERFPGVTVIKGDAYDLDATLPKSQVARASAVVSSLPLVARPLHEREALIEMGLARLAPENAFIQFSYLRNGPVAGIPGRFTAEASPWIWMNLPPARVWLYRKPNNVAG
jgi:phosphatidylethanolamine/phosphatidyl-N-methylethanolamine N-methyltransferase